MKKTALFCLVFVLSNLLAFQAFAQTLPDKVIGNWINRSTNNWEYGFFEKFAIYQNDFWDYESVSSDKKGNTSIVLSKGKERLSVKLKLSKDNMLSVEKGIGKAVKFAKMGLVYPDYPTKDEAFFAKPSFRQDSATIIGYFRNREKIPQEFKSRLVNQPFKVAVSNMLTDAEDNYTADFDSLGRFRLRIPITNMQELYVDWNRTHAHMSLEAGNTIFLFSDLADYIPLEKDASQEGYYKRPKQLLFMGDNARLNNELHTFKPSMLYSDRKRSSKVSDMEYLTHCDSISKERLKVLDVYIQQHPTVSEKFKAFQLNFERFQLLSDLMQHRFDARRTGKPTMDSAFISFVRGKSVMNQEWMYTGLRDFRTFLRDWVGYHEEIKGATQVTLTFKELLAFVRTKKDVPAETTTLLEQMAAMNDAFEKAKPEEREGLQLKYKPLLEKAQTITPFINQIATEMLSARPKPTSVSDSLLTNVTLRRLWNAQSYFRIMDQSHLPLKAEQLKSMQEAVVIPSMVEQLETVHRFYQTVAKTGMTYAASLKNTEHLKEYKDAKALFDELTKPYKGKVIYVDFWGTWCGPCKENMKYVKGLKEKLNGQPVVFMYFANNSPEDSWKSILKEMDLTGENVVHYRLPDEQEAMIERMFEVKKFPTYLLINKEGQVVNIDAKSPMSKEGVLNQIAELF